MNRLLLLCIFIFCGTILYSQNVVIDGVTFSTDGSTLIKFPTDKFYEEYIIPEGTKIIGKKAFAEAWVEKVKLPTTLTHINDSAFYNGPTDFILTGKFPIIGNRVWSWERLFEVSEGNPYCRVSDDGFVYSKDGKTVHIVPIDIRGCLEDIEIIDRYAFQDCYFRYGYVDIPNSVHLIREYAFDNIKPNLPTRSEPSYYNFKFTCGALTPPELEGEVFTENNVGNSTLYVPKGTGYLYKATPQWNTFGAIEEDNPGPPQGVSANSVSALKINRMDGTIHIETSKSLETVKLINLNGNIVYEKSGVNSYHTTCGVSSLDGFVGLLQVVYKDGDREVIKLNF